MRRFLFIVVAAVGVSGAGAHTRRVVSYHQRRLLVYDSNKTAAELAPHEELERPVLPALSARAMLNARSHPQTQAPTSPRPSRPPRAASVSHARTLATATHATPALRMQPQVLAALDWSAELAAAPAQLRAENAATRLYVLDSGCNVPGAIAGPSFVPGEPGIYDASGHGTFVASSALRAAPGATLLCARIFDKNEHGTTGGTAQAMLWAAEDCAGRACVLNLSGGALGGSAALDALANDLVTVHNVLGVYAGGNYVGAACNYSPAAAAQALNLGATDLELRFAYYSASGPCVDLFAPGTNIVGRAAAPPHALQTMSGTSVSAAFGSGAALLARAAEPTLLAQDARAWLLRLAAARGPVVTNVPPATTALAATAVAWNNADCCSTRVFRPSPPRPPFADFRNAWRWDFQIFPSHCLDFTTSATNNSFWVGAATSPNATDVPDLFVFNSDGFTVNRARDLGAPYAAKRLRLVRSASGNAIEATYMAGPRHALVLSASFVLPNANVSAPAHVYVALAGPWDYTGVTRSQPCTVPVDPEPGATLPPTPAMHCASLQQARCAHARGSCAWDAAAGLCVARGFCERQSRALCLSRAPRCRWAHDRCVA
jgi:hypothetical protein